MDKPLSERILDKSPCEVDDSSSEQVKFEEPLQTIRLSPDNVSELTKTSNLHVIIDGIVPDVGDSGQTATSKTLEDSGECSNHCGQGDGPHNVTINNFIKTTNSECGLELGDQPVKHMAQADKVSIDETKSDTVAIKEGRASTQDQSILKEKIIHVKQDASTVAVSSLQVGDVKDFQNFKESHPNVAFFKVFDPSGHIKEVKVESDWKPSIPPDPRNEELVSGIAFYLLIFNSCKFLRSDFDGNLNSA